ncbi:hypothetical protein [Chitinimonas koreensis]|uniref:hypothetical protein n=1 Tax=Chitinimonas koreensis TaxID=356302 RepID=UPI0012FBE172|nr:hypothetical protein [Chitinimonas koreensis]QNM95348.1 hypothetical protein H9L41_15925 [Chitinimonas koreensis]
MEFLFERLSPPRARSREAMLPQAVLDQLEWLVGSREWLAEQGGTALIDIAMPETPALAAGGAPIARYAERLKRLIERYEPRLKGIEISLEETGRTLSPYRVVVSGVLDQGGPDGVVRFETQVDAERR